MDKSSAPLRVGYKSDLISSQIGESLGKVPPQALELEEAVLGALMLEKDALSAIADILKPEVFYKDAHRVIYEAIIFLFNDSQPVDLLTVTSQLRKDGTLDVAGGAYAVTALTTRVNSAANVEYHSRIIIEMAIKRELIRMSGEVQQKAYEETTDVFDLLDQTEAALFDISEQNIRRNYADMKTIMSEALTELEARQKHKDGLTGVPSGFSALDRITSGWQKSDLIIIAARPGMGKTAFVVSAMRNAAVDFGKPVAIFSLEMSSVQLVNRLISAESELEGDKIKKGSLADYEWQQLLHKTEKLSKAPIFIDDTPALTILELRAKCRRLKSQHDIQLIIVDYLQLMSADARGGGNREQEIATISRALKGLAKELEVPVIALSQLSRAVETRGGDKRPQLSDLRESGSIEQDADIVMFLYRPEYYGLNEDSEGMPTTGMGEVIIAKHRNGSLGNVKLKFIGKFTKFTDIDFNDNSGFGASSFPSDTGSGFTNTVTLQSGLNADDDDPDEPEDDGPTPF